MIVASAMDAMVRAIQAHCFFCGLAGMFWLVIQSPCRKSQGSGRLLRLQARRTAVRTKVLSRRTEGSPDWRVTAAPVSRAPGPGKERALGYITVPLPDDRQGSHNWDGEVSFERWLAIAAVVAGVLCLPFRVAALLVEHNEGRRRLLDQIGMMLAILSAGWIILALLV